MGMRRALEVVTGAAWRAHDSGRAIDGETNAAMAAAAKVSARTIRVAKAIVRAGLADRVLSGDLCSAQAYRRATKGDKAAYGKSVVYFLRAGPFVKIGLASFGDVQARIEDLQTGCPYEITLLAVTIGDRSAELKLHRRFESLRSRATGEWFAFDGDLEMYIAHLHTTPIAF